jgi:hypothetical protein
VALALLAGALILAPWGVALAQVRRSPATRPAIPGQQAPGRAGSPNVPGALGLNRIDVVVDPEKLGETVRALTLRQAIARQFATQDLCPQERMMYFASLKAKPPGSGMGLWLVGWWGVIEQITPDPDGWLVRVVVEPQLENGGTVVHRIEDTYSEVYRYSAGALRFVRASVPPKSPRSPVITFN